MNAVASKHLMLIGVLAGIALAINSTIGFGRRNDGRTSNFTSQSWQPARRPVEANTAVTPVEAERVNYFARYVTSGASRRPGFKMAAVAVMTEDRKFNHAVNAAIVPRLENGSVQILPFFFRSEFASDGVLDETFKNPSDVVRKLELSKCLDELLLARQQIQYSSDPSLENVITANMQLDVMIFSVLIPDQLRAWTLRANGAGFTEKDARAMAEERLIKQIANDPKISFNQ